MQTMQPTLRLGRDVWDRDRMPVAEFSERAARLRAAMEHLGLEAMLLYGRGLDRCGYPTYLSNYTVKLPFGALVVLPRDGDPTLLFEGSTRGRSAAQATTWIEDVRPCWNIGAACADVLAQQRLLSGVVGLAGLPRLMPHGDWRALAGALASARQVGVDAAVDALRAVKSERERAQVGRAAEIVRASFDAASGAALAPPTETRLAASLVRAARRQGAEDVRVMIAASLESDWVFRPPEDIRLPPGAATVVLLRASWERYWAEGIRAFVMEPDGRVATTPDDEGRTRLDAAVAALRAGRLEGQAAAHGVGVEPEEPPFFPPGPGRPVASGACLAVRIVHADRRLGRIARGDTIVF